MNLPVSVARLVEKVSDERDTVRLVNAIRDGIVNQEVLAYPPAFKTTNATVTAAWTDVMPADSIGDFLFTAVGQSSDLTNVGSYRRRAVIQRIGTGAVTYIGAGADIIGVDKNTVPAWAVNFALDATVPGSLFAVVAGAANTAITWRTCVQGFVLPWS